MERQWWHNSVVYQIYPRSFFDSNGDGIGDIRGIIAKLDYLKFLGIDILWLSPVNQSPMDDNGYDVSDYYKIAKEFGSLKDMEELITEADKRSIKIMMDMVINHSSDEHPWFKESRSSRNNPKRDWYIWRDPSPDKGVPNNWISFFSGSVWEYDEETRQYYLHLFGKKQPDFNWENPGLREQIYKMMNWWLDKGVKGLRLDVINGLSKPSDFPDGDENSQMPGVELFMNGPKIHKYLRELNERVFSNHKVVTVGETNFVDPQKAIEYTAPERRELDMVFQFEHMSVDKGLGGKWDCIPLDFVKLKRVLSKWQVEMYNKGWNSLYWNNHDQPRAVSRFGEDGAYRIKSAKMLAAALYMMQGTPFIYQGEEIGMTNCNFASPSEYRDIETINYYNNAMENSSLESEVILDQISRAGRDNARTPMQWDDSSHSGFTTGDPWIKVNPRYTEINVKESLENKDSIFYFYQKLIKIRKSPLYGEVVIYGDYKLFFEDDRSIFAYLRTYKERKLFVVCNFAIEERRILLNGWNWSSRMKLLLSNYSDSKYHKEELLLRPYEGMILFC